MMDLGMLSPAVHQALDLACGLASLIYCVISALAVLRGFLLKRAVTVRQINAVASVGMVSTALYLLVLLLGDVGFTLWSCLNLASNMTFLLFFKSRRKPRLAVYALYIQALVYMAFVMRLITTRMDVSMLVSFVVFQLIPAVLLIGVGIIILFQTVRERRSGPEENIFFPDEEAAPPSPAEPMDGEAIYRRAEEEHGSSPNDKSTSDPKQS